MPKVLPRPGASKADASPPQPQAAETPEADWQQQQATHIDSSETSSPSGAVVSDRARTAVLDDGIWKGDGSQARAMRERACAFVCLQLNP